jgi:extracellular matrix protein 14
MTRAFINLILLGTCAYLSAAVPTADNSPRDQTPTLPYSSLFSNPFRTIRDALIEQIWTVPQKSKSKQLHSHSSAPANYRTRYGNDVVLRFNIRVEEEVKAFSEAVDILYLDVWEVGNGWVDIRVAKDMVPSLLGLLPPTLHTSHAPIMHDLAQAVYDTYPDHSSTEERILWGSSTPQVRGESGHTPRDVFFQNYQPLSVLYPWLRLMASLFPSHVSLSSIGLSAEGRDIPALRVGARVEFPPGHEHDSRPTLLITGGSHAREWISVSSAAYIAYNLVTAYDDPRFADVTKLLNHFDVVFLPVLNPDGYEYTFSTDRLWRKTRQETPLPFCPGIDMDRAFTFGWDGKGAADNPCSEDFAGGSPLESIEAIRLTEWARNQTENDVNLVAYLDLHSYSQEVLYPYSYSCDVEPPNLEDLEEVALGLAKAFRLTSGHYYGIDSACEGSIALKAEGRPRSKSIRGQVEPQGGSALDFFYHDMKVKYAYQIKLRDTGTYGFLLPKEYIVPTGDEAFEAVLGLGRWLLGNHGIEKIDPSEIWSAGRSDDLEKQEQSEAGNEDDDVEYEFELMKRR